MEATIRQAIRAALSSLKLEVKDFSVEYPKDMAHGDYASNVALVAAKEAGQAPRQVAEQLVAALSGTIPDVAAIDIAGPGFINFTLSRDFFSEKIPHIPTDPSWGKNTSLHGKKIVVEYTDPNPFKEFHIGHLFTNAVGESVARLFMMGGADVKRVCYQGDVGMHVAMALWGMQALGLMTKADITPRALGQAYARGATAYKTDTNAASEIRILNKAVYERTDKEINALYDMGRTVSLEYFASIYKILGTTFEEFFFESEAGPIGKQLVLSHPEVFPESEGARIFDGEARGLHTRVFINKEGLPTYEAKELALAKMKEDRLGTYDLSVISTSNEINEYFKVLRAALAEIYPTLAEKTEHIGHGTVRLTTGKMSSRTGDVIVASEFIEEVTNIAHTRMKESGHVDDEGTARQVAIGAIKYATLKGNILQDTVFDPEQALSFEGDSGPYLQYTYARISSVVEKALTLGIVPSAVQVPDTLYEVERLVIRFPEVVEEALDERAPHKVAQYLTEIAGSFNTFYAANKIADNNDAFAPYKVAIAMAVAKTLKNGLWVLGIEAPERM